MKTIIILFIAVVISFGAKAQPDLKADSTLTLKYIGVEYMFIDTFIQGSSGNVDTLMYSEIVSKRNLSFKSVPDPIIPNNDTIYKLMDLYKFDWLYSVKVVRYRKVSKFIQVSVEKPVEFQMYDLAVKRKQLSYPVDSFWIHPKVKAIRDE